MQHTKTTRKTVFKHCPGLIQLLGSRHKTALPVTAYIRTYVGTYLCLLSQNAIRFYRHLLAEGAGRANGGGVVEELATVE